MALTLESAARLLDRHGLLREIIRGDVWTLDPHDIKGFDEPFSAITYDTRKVEPDTAMALAQQLFAAADDVKAQDGAFLIADELAKKGNAQALLMLGDFYSPKQPQRGTIQKDTDMAGDCYKKALAAGAAEAQQRLDALK